jgi:hypothetical protein
MSIQAPQGILNIPNATLRVGRLAVDEVVGADTALNTIARNTILLVDDATYHENKNWALKLPNAWAGEFECNTASAGNYSEFNFYNEGASSSAQGYNLTFNDTAVQLRYDGTLLTSGTLASTVTGAGVKKVRLMFERTILSVTVDGTLIFTHDDTSGPRPRVYSTTAGGFLNFFTDGGAIKNLKIVNEKWMSDGTSNIAYVGGGEVAIGQSLNLQQVSNTSMIKMNSNVVTEFPRSKKLIKYPRVALTSAAQTVSGYEGYIVTRSSQFASLSAWKVFDNDNPVGGNSGVSAGWASAGPGLVDPRYIPTTGDVTEYAATHPDGLIQGEWIQIQLPDAIYLHDIKIHSRADTSFADAMNGFPKNVYLYGKKSNDWVLVKIFTTVSKTDGDSHTEYIDYTKEAFTHFVLVVNSIHVSSQAQGGYPGWTTIGQIELFGVPEYDPEAHGTDVVVKSYPNVPNTDWLEVYYDAKDLEDGSTTVNDLKPVGTAVNGTMVGNTTVSDGAFVFDGAGDYIYNSRTGYTASSVYTASVWVKFLPDAGTSTDPCIFQFGNGSDHSSFGMISDTSANRLRAFIFGNNAVDIDERVNNIWHHLSATYYVSNGRTDFFINGMLKKSVTSGTAMTIPSTPYLSIGVQTNSSNVPISPTYFTGSIANFRLFNRALTSDEIWQLYAYQKEYFGHGDLGMTLKAGRLGIGTSEPRAMLDVRGIINAETFYGLNDATVAYKYFGTDTTVFTFTGLNLKVGEAYKIVLHYHNTVANHHVHMFVNGDETDSNYWHAIQQVTSTFAAAGSTGNTAKIFSTGNTSDHIWVYDLRLSWDGRPMMMGHGHFSTPSNPSGMDVGANQSWRLGTWFHNAKTNAITTLKFDPTSTGAFGAGSSIRILKMM